MKLPDDMAAESEGNLRAESLLLPLITVNPSAKRSIHIVVITATTMALRDPRFTSIVELRTILARAVGEGEEEGDAAVWKQQQQQQQQSDLYLYVLRFYSVARR